MLDVHRLRVFRSVVASGSIQAAAANLGYTASAVSQHVSALQQETGLTLISRVGRGIEPTAAGRALAAQVDGVLSRLGEVELVVGDLRAGRTGSLSIGYFASVGSAWMPSVVRSLTAAYPDLRLTLSLREVLPEDPADRPDLQVVVQPRGFVPAAGLRAVHLLDDPYVAVLPVDHPLADQPAIELARLAPDRWIDNDVFRGWCRQNLLDACRAAGFTPTFQLETHDYRTAIAFVDAGIGLTVLPALGAVDLPPGAVAVPVTCPTPVRSIHVVVQTSVLDTPPVRTALAELRRCAAGAATAAAAGLVSGTGGAGQRRTSRVSAS
jgi:DNA-binding transcriptional LysR family regulator